MSATCREPLSSDHRVGFRIKLKKMKNRHSPILLAFLSVAVAVVGCLVFLELLFQFLPVRSGLNAQPVSAAQPVFRFESNRTAMFSKNWNLALANRIRTNNAGFVNLQDYDATARTPLLAVVGDSYIEAAMVPQADTVHARLQQYYGDTRRVYSFAASGAGLAQYLAWIRFARDTYKPDRLLVTIIANDFSETLWSRERNPGFHGFRRDPQSGWAMELAPFEPSKRRKLFRQSALVRYLVLNLQVLDFARSGFLAAASEQRWVSNVAAQVDEAFFDEALWATQVFLNVLPEFSGLSRDNIVIAIDGVRPQVYAGRSLDALADTYWVRMRSAFIARARAGGYEVVDLQDAFAEDYARNTRRFEFEIDSHWNSEGHRVLFEQASARRALVR
jgi:hypothetical protein